jgi:monooxygenase
MCSGYYSYKKKTKTSQCTPRLRGSDADMPERPWIDDFTSRYLQRTMHLLPRQGDRKPWLDTQNYQTDKMLLGKGPLDEGVMSFTETKVPAQAKQLGCGN